VGAGRTIFTALVAFAATAAAHAERLQIQFAEKVQVSAAAGRTEFDAYGRRFVLELAGNDRLLAKLPAQRKASLAKLHLWRGRLEGQPGSWLRLTEVDGRMEGVIWDGRDLYSVTRYEKIAPNLTTPLAAAPGDTVVFRLSDTLDFLPRAYCALERSADGLAPNNGLVQYRKLVGELGTRVQAAAIPLTDQLDIALIADSALAARFADPTAEMLAAFNVVDGIYAQQVGLLVLPADVRVVDAAGDPFTVTDPSPLLAQLSTFRQGIPAVLNAGIAHLLTGKDLDGDIIGIARLGSVCSAPNGVSLSEGWGGATRTGLIMAHEFGHNLGAEHDNEPGICAASPPGYLMDPYYNNSATFSQCSLDTMRAVIANAQCITTAMYGDVELSAPSSVPEVENDTSLQLPFTVRSVGTAPARASRLVVTAPANLRIIATDQPASCTLAGNTVTCELGDIPASEERVIGVTFLPAEAGYYIVQAQALASNNRYTNNDRRSVSVQVAINADAAVAMTATATSVFTGDIVDYTISVTSLRSHPSPNTYVTFSYQMFHVLQAESATVTGGGTCNVQSQQVQCALGDVVPGTTRTIQIRTRGLAVGTTRMLASVYSDADADFNNNLALVDIDVKAVHDVGVEDVTQPSLLQLGMPFELKANLHSTGIQSVDGVSVRITLPAETTLQNSITSVTVGGTSCVRTQYAVYECIVGTMAAGEILPISVKGTAVSVGYFTMWAQPSAAIQDDGRNDFYDRTFMVVYGLDASVTSYSGAGGLEGAELSSGYYVMSNGFFPSNDTVVVTELPPELRFTRFLIGDPAMTACAITDPQHLRCTFNVPQQNVLPSVGYYITGNVPGNYQATTTLTLTGDQNPVNNTVQTSVTVGAIVDVAINQFTMPNYLYVGRNETVPVTVVTGSRPADNVQVSVLAAPAGQLVSVTTDTGSCTRSSPQSFNCALGNLPGNATVNLIAVVTTDSVPSYPYGQLTVRLESPSDYNLANNARSWSYQAKHTADVSVALGGVAVTGTVGTPLILPSINVRHTGPLANGRFQLTLPAGVTITSMSGTLTPCSGTTVLQCYLSEFWDENLVLTLAVTLDVPTASTFNVAISAIADNDFNTSNGEASIAVAVNAVAPPPPPPPPPSSGGGNSGGGGGGGGRFEWLALALLGLLAARRSRSH